jgi:Tfp pilus assembly protein PilF
VAGLSCKTPIVFGLAFALLGVNVCSLSAQELPQELVKQIKQAVVTINTFDKKGKDLMNGSGFFIGARQIITCEHTLQSADSMEVKLANGRLHHVLRRPPERLGADLVLLEVEMAEAKAESLTFAGTLPREGERIYVVGSPLGLEPSVSTGIVGAFQKLAEFGELKVMQIDAAVSPGCSGGPVVNRHGEVIGVANSRFFKQDEKVSFAVPLINHAAALGFKKPQPTARLTALSETLDSLAAENVHYEWGKYFFFQQDYEKAIASLEKALAQDSAHVESLFYTAHSQFYLGRYRQAIETCNKALALNPDHAEACMIMGLAYGQLGEHDKKIEIFQRALQINPDYAQGHYYLGSAYESMGRDSDAIEALKKAIENDPAYAKAHYLLGLVYMKLQRPEAAFKVYRILKEIDGDLARKLLEAIGE